MSRVRSMIVAGTAAAAIIASGGIPANAAYSEITGRASGTGSGRQHGNFHRVDYPTRPKSTYDSLGGVNDAGIAIGTYGDEAGNHEHAFRYNIRTGAFSLPVRGADSIGSNINDKGAVVGFFKKPDRPWVSFVAYQGHLDRFTAPGAEETDAQAINDRGVVVGEALKNGQTVGFIRPSSDKPARLYFWGPTKESMVINGINDVGDIVGWYMDSTGKMKGFLGIPRA